MEFYILSYIFPAFQKKMQLLLASFRFANPACDVTAS